MPLRLCSFSVSEWQEQDPWLRFQGNKAGTAVFISLLFFRPIVRTSLRHTLWQARYYDFNVYSRNKRLEKLDYMHWNPVKRGLVERMEDWQWSSYGFYRTGQQGRVFIHSGWADHYKPD